MLECSSILNEEPLLLERPDRGATSMPLQRRHEAGREVPIAYSADYGQAVW